MWCFFCVDSGELERRRELIYQELIHMPERVGGWIINHIRRLQHKGFCGFSKGQKNIHIVGIC
jgi:hypothetical protein